MFNNRVGCSTSFGRCLDKRVSLPQSICFVKLNEKSMQEHFSLSCSVCMCVCVCASLCTKNKITHIIFWGIMLGPCAQESHTSIRLRDTRDDVNFAFAEKKSPFICTPYGGVLTLFIFFLIQTH